MLPELPALVPALSARIRPIVDWLLLEGNRLTDMDALFAELIDRVAAAGLPIGRVSLNLELLHPEVVGEGRVWLCGQATQAHRVHRVDTDLSEYLSSPVYQVDQTNQPYRVRLATEQTEMSLLRRLQADGFTDYYIIPMQVQDRHRTAAMSFAAKRVPSFSDDDIRDLEHIVAAVSPVLEARVVRSIACDLLTTYLGQGAGERVYAGQIQRGDAESIFAAVLFCDLRNFTRYTAEHLSHEVVARLNHWFELAVDAVEAHGGEVLKFIGDGMLAIFPADMLNPREACGHALAAAATLEAAVARWNEAPPAGQIALEYGLSLHLGHVAFGNIGGRRRLDFTVVGPAVNMTSRLLDAAKALDCPLVVSTAFAGCSGRPMRSLGVHALRGIDQPEEIFTPH
ncbi:MULTISPECIES: adenylate/guanylate cyclase domain-containing protein [unclassified Azospirillum]|uniref:adenylate/guanylate cyclase domain-containing protein n=1 Tax=unclassified Azospirillum TaxID=2630922 RepID=UPI000B77AD27|nr:MULTISPECIES: adenylate/guanylate cyclase domain-containing protein [unclassified Azospirillum]